MLSLFPSWPSVLVIFLNDAIKFLEKKQFKKRKGFVWSTVQGEVHFISYFSAAVVKHHGQGDLRKERVIWLRAPSWQNRGMVSVARRWGSYLELQVWSRKKQLKAGRSYLSHGLQMVSLLNLSLNTKGEHPSSRNETENVFTCVTQEAVGRGQAKDTLRNHL